MRRLSDESGNVIILTTLLMTVLFGVLALVVDIGGLLVQHRSLQTGADAAALAVARRCAEDVVTAVAPCENDDADTITEAFFDANIPSGIAPDLNVDLDTYDGGRAGRVSVAGSTDHQLRFAGVLGFADTTDTQGDAVAEWGPVARSQAVFPLTICNGALPLSPDGVVDQLAFDPAAIGPGPCDGDALALPVGWATPSDLANCTASVTLQPGTPFTWELLPVSLSGGCADSVNDLANAILDPSSDVEDRTRILAVYDATSGGLGTYEPHALIAFEFTGLRVAGWDVTNGVTWSGSCDPALLGDVVCVRGYVRDYVPPMDEPIVDPALAALPGISDTTVLDVRLAD